MHLRPAVGPVHGILARGGETPMKQRLVNVFTDSVVWVSVACAASGLGLLLDAVWQSLGGR